MNRMLLALVAATSVGLTAPASALSFQVDLPNLTYPTQPAPDTSQGCASLTTPSGTTCTTTTK
jgi:hypothetical protein